MFENGSKLSLKLFIVLILLVFVDQLTKGWASTSVINFGFFLSSLTWTSPFYRIFCTLGLLSVCVTVISLIQFLTLKRAPYFCLGLVFLEAGLIGNGIDRIRLGGVRDFIEISFFHPSLILNVADIYQWVSGAMLMWMLWRDPHKIWPEKNLRGSYLVYPESQLRMVFSSVLILILISLSNLIFFYAYFKTNNIIFPDQELIFSFFVFTLLIGVIVVVFSLVWSHRIYGPFRAIVRYLNQLKGPERFKVQTRKSDEMECVSEILNLIQDLEEMRSKPKPKS